jgi:hypothetical protein
VSEFPTYDTECSVHHLPQPCPKCWNGPSRRGALPRKDAPLATIALASIGIAGAVILWLWLK